MVRPIRNNTRSSIVPAIYTDYLAYKRPTVSALSIKNFIMFLKFIAFTKIAYLIESSSQVYNKLFNWSKKLAKLLLEIKETKKK